MLKIIFIIVLGLTGCTTLTASNRADLAAGKITSDICGLLPPITYDGNRDTPETKAQIREFNLKRNAYCS